MFHLYNNTAGWEELYRSEDELDILEVLTKSRKINPGSDYIVVDKNPNRDDITTTITKEEDFIEYQEKFNIKQKVLIKKRGN